VCGPPDTVLPHCCRGRVLEDGACRRESAAEARIIKFVKEIYPGGDAVRVKLTTVPAQLRENVKIVNLSFVRIPDVGGDGVCSVEIETARAGCGLCRCPSGFSRSANFTC
jgi:hypothetical protein